MTGQFEYERKTDRDLYDGLDSAIKAALFWVERDRSIFQHAALYVPVLVTGRQFWNVRIDSDRDPMLQDSIYMIGRYPVFGSMVSIISLITTSKGLGSSIGKGLDGLFEWFHSEQIEEQRMA